MRAYATRRSEGGLAASPTAEAGAPAVVAYRDTSGKHVEYGRYVAVLVPGSDGWRMDRFFGFSDSTAKR